MAQDENLGLLPLNSVIPLILSGNLTAAFEAGAPSGKIQTQVFPDLTGPSFHC